MAVTREVNPIWLRAWHGLQALCFFGLLLTGLSMHYSDAGWVFLPFPIAVRAHNTFGVSCASLWLFFVIANLLSGNARHYVPHTWRFLDRVWRQLRHYAWGMFVGEPPPFPAGFVEKFNPVQKMVYGLVMYLVMPTSVVSGTILLYPLWTPARAFERSGLWATAVVHLTAGYVLTLFVVLHIYLATTGDTIGALYREMFTGLRTSVAPPAPDE